MSDPSQYADAPAPQQVIGQAIQDVTAARLGRAFVPLASIAVAGVVEVVLVGLASTGGWLLVSGAAATAGAMLAFGLRNTQLAFGRPHRPWMSFAMLGSLIPPAFTIYVLAWRGLRLIAGGDDVTMRLMGVGMALMGAWALRSWMQLVEVQSLARAMSPGTDMNERGVL